MNKPNLIVFDMDGVIVDVSRSYRDTVRQTAGLFLRGARSHEKLPDPLFSLTDLARVKQAGGLNNDWELTYHALRLLLTQAKMPVEKPMANAWELHERFIPFCDLSDLARFLKSEEQPLEKLHTRYGSPQNMWIERLSAGDVGSGNVIKQIFQEIYLGGDLFKRTYGIEPRACREEGFIDRESLLIPASFFAALTKMHLLAIATGRPRAEAQHALRRFHLQSLFELTYTLDDCLVEEQAIFADTGKNVVLSKPHPFMLDAIAQTLCHTITGRYYIGDMPDDMMAAARANPAFSGIGILHSAPDKDTLRERLLKAGADKVVKDANELMKIFR